MVSVPARIAQSTSGATPVSAASPRLVRARAHGRLALNVYDEHEHAVGCNRHVFGERPLNMLLHPTEHVHRKRLALHAPLGERTHMPVEQGHMPPRQSPTAHKRWLCKVELLRCGIAHTSSHRFVIHNETKKPGTTASYHIAEWRKGKGKGPASLSQSQLE